MSNARYNTHIDSLNAVNESDDLHSPMKMDDEFMSSSTFDSYHEYCNDGYAIKYEEIDDGSISCYLDLLNDGDPVYV